MNKSQDIEIAPQENLGEHLGSLCNNGTVPTSQCIQVREEDKRRHYSVNLFTVLENLWNKIMHIMQY